MPFLVKITTTQTHSIDFEFLQKVVDAAGGNDGRMTMEEMLNLGGGPLCREAESDLIELFELHDGSMFGDKIFPSRADFDVGRELIWEED